MKSNYKTQKAYFKGNSRFGRTTQLVEKKSGNVIAEYMGVCSLDECLKSFRLANA